MPQKPLISIGQLIDQTWDTYKARFTELMSVSGWFLVVAVLQVISLAFYPSVTLVSGLNFFQSTGVILFTLTSFVIAPLLSIWIMVALIRLSMAHLGGRSLNVKKASDETKKKFWPVLVVSVMVFLVLIVAMLLAFSPAILLALLSAMFKQGAFIVLANILLILGVFATAYLAIKWSVSFYMAPFATAMDNENLVAIPSGAKVSFWKKLVGHYHHGRSAMNQSRQLVQGRFWATTWRLIVPKIVFLIFGAFIMYVISYTTSVMTEAISGLNLDLYLRIQTMTDTVVPTVIAVLLNPLVVLSDVLLYRSLKGEA